MMKTFIFAFALTLLVTPASAYTCQDVRAFVAENGLAQARAKARAAGMTDAQERQAGRHHRLSFLFVPFMVLDTLPPDERELVETAAQSSAGHSTRSGGALA